MAIMKMQRIVSMNEANSGADHPTLRLRCLLIDKWDRLNEDDMEFFDNGVEGKWGWGF